MALTHGVRPLASASDEQTVLPVHRIRANIAQGDGIDPGRLRAHVLYGYDGLPESRAQITLGRIDDTGARTPNAGQCTVSGDQDAGWTLTHARDGSPQAGTWSLQTQVPDDRMLWGHAVRVYLPENMGGTIARLPGLGDRYAGVTIGSIHGRTGLGIFAAPVFDAGDGGGIALYTFALDGTGARIDLGTLSMEWVEHTLTFLFVWDALSGDVIVRIVIDPEEGEDAVEQSATYRFNDLTPALPATQIGLWSPEKTVRTSASESSASVLVCALESTQAGDSIHIQQVDVLVSGVRLFRAGNARDARVRIASDAFLRMDETIDTGFAGYDDGGVVTRVSGGLSLLVGPAHVSDGVVQDGDGWSTGGWAWTAILRAPEMLHTGSFFSGVGVRIGDGVQTIVVALLDDFSGTRSIGLRIGEDDIGAFGSYEVVEEVDWTATTEIAVWFDPETGYGLQINRGTVHMIESTPDEVENTPGAYLGALSSVYPKADVIVQVDHVDAMPRARVFQPGVSVVNGETVWGLSGDGPVVTDNALILTDAALTVQADTFEPTWQSGCAVTVDLHVRSWVWEGRASPSRVPIGPLLWLRESDTRGIGLYAIEGGDGQTYLYLRTGSEDDGDVLARTERGVSISYPAPTLLHARTRITVLLDPWRGLRLCLDGTPGFAIQRSGWSPVPDGIDGSLPLTVGGYAGILAVFRVAYGSGRGLALDVDPIIATPDSDAALPYTRADLDIFMQAAP